MKDFINWIYLNLFPKSADLFIEQTLQVYKESQTIKVLHSGKTMIEMNLAQLEAYNELEGNEPLTIEICPQWRM